MKLLIVYPTQERGGAEGYALTIARHAIQRDWQVEIGAPYHAATAPLNEDFRQAGAVWKELKIGRAATLLGRRPRPLVPWVEAWHTAWRIARSRPDAILFVLPGIKACFASQLTAAALGTPALCCFQLTPRTPWRAGWLRRKLLQWSRGRGQRWTCVSNHNRAFVSAAFDVPIEELLLIPNGARIRPPAKVDRAGVLATLGIPEEARVVLTVARLGIQKAHAILLDGIALLPPELGDVHFVWLGEGEQRPALEQRRVQLGLAQRVHMPGFAEVGPWLAAADVFAFPTGYEGLPFSLVEAMAAGLPIAASNVSSIPELLDNGAGGLLVENTPETWAAALQKLLSDATLAEHLSAHARDAAARYSEGAMVEATLSALTQLAKGETP